MKKVYIAGPYSGDSPEEVDYNIIVARGVMADLLRQGYAPFCPHTMTAAFDRHYPDICYEIYLETDMEWLKCCDAIYLLPRWEKSAGAVKELALAMELGIEVFNLEALGVGMPT